MHFLKNRTAIGVICIMLSLLICFGITPLFNKSISQKTEILRVTKEIKEGDEITKDMIQSVEVGSFGLPNNIIRQKESVIGKYAKADMFVGDYILNTKISDTPVAENSYLYNLNGTKQAMSISIKSFANGLSGKLISGDIVSVIAADYRKQGITVIPNELRYVEVVTVTAPSGYDANTEETKLKKDERELPSTVTLLVSPEQSKVLAELEADGKLHLSLVYRGKHENAMKFIDAQDKINDELYPKLNKTESEEQEDIYTDPQDENSEDKEILDIPEKSSEELSEKSVKSNEITTTNTLTERG